MLDWWLGGYICEINVKNPNISNVLNTSNYGDSANDFLSLIQNWTNSLHPHASSVIKQYIKQTYYCCSNQTMND